MGGSLGGRGGGRERESLMEDDDGAHVRGWPSRLNLVTSLGISPSLLPRLGPRARMYSTLHRSLRIPLEPGRERAMGKNCEANACLHPRGTPHREKCSPLTGFLNAEGSFQGLTSLLVATMS